MIIYEITNNGNQKSYIGQTNFDLEKRIDEHIKASKKRKPPLYIHRAIKKYGLENFSYRMLVECETQQELDETEIRLIKERDTMAPHGGYNMTMNAGGGDNFSNHPNKDEIRKRISEATKRGIARAIKEGKRKTWAADRKGSKNGMHGRKHSPETIEKMSRNRRGKCMGDENPGRFQKKDKLGRFTKK